ncbi:MAG: helix-turn-helix domain-containing protein [Gammaproteobacteria bacterium]|nr:helix-turn-helix domain-containing protein [Gammaproteobacteria bacterium]
MFIRSPKELALYVISQRKKLKLSQTKVASLVGLTQKTISAFENKPESTELNTVFRILSAVNLDIYTLPKNEKILPNPQWKEEW